MPRPNWSRPLPTPLTILDDIMGFCGYDARRRPRDCLECICRKARGLEDTRQHVEAELKKAEANGDTTQVWITLQIVLVLERVEFRLL